MYQVTARHYGEAEQVLSTHKTKAEAERFMLQQAEILKGYFKRTMMLDGDYICLAEDADYYQTRLRVRRKGQ